MERGVLSKRRRMMSGEPGGPTSCSPITWIDTARVRPVQSAGRPRANGEVERYNRTLLEEWAYVRPIDQRATGPLPVSLAPPVQPSPVPHSVEGRPADLPCQQPGWERQTGSGSRVPR